MAEQDAGDRIEQFVQGLTAEDFIPRLDELRTLFADPANWRYYFRAEPAIWLQYAGVLTDDQEQNRLFREAYLALGEFLLPAYKSLRK